MLTDKLLIKMNIIDLKPTGVELYVADDVVRTAQELQEHLASVHPEAQTEQAAHAIEAMGDPRTINGARKVLVHSLGAVILYQGLSLDDILYDGTYLDEVFLRADFSRLAFVRSSSMRSLCLSLFDIQILRADKNPRFEGTTIRTGVFVPVHAVESVLSAA